MTSLTKLMKAAAAVIAMAGSMSIAAADGLTTRWAAEVDDSTPWNVYPRPTLERSEWKNLNGKWQYAIVAQKEAEPAEWQGEILVPYAVESKLSGVERRLGDGEALWYNRKFTVPTGWKGQDIMLNFDAVDWACDVWVNDIKVGSHKGGYSPFSLDITPALNARGENKLTVRVTDPTDGGYQPRGKQVRRNEGIWYTPVTGIWQTVWLEPVGARHIASLRTEPDIDNKTLTVNVRTNCDDSRIVKQVNVKEGDKVIATARATGDQPLVLHMPGDVKLWSPDSPALYDLEVSISEGGKTLDRVNSYAAMRKISTGRDENGIIRLQLNNKTLFQYGPLDQGWWPDGLYTAPTYDAMVYDIDKTKDWGFNMIRKHVKVEPELWYAYCDKKGLLVWQDMPSGDRGPEWQPNNWFAGSERIRSAESEANYRREWKEIIDSRFNHPSIVVWVPFNESWGQFKSPEIAEWTGQYDPTRLVNQSSGGNHYQAGDMIDVHHYPGPGITVVDGQRANVLGEFGGIGMVVKDHIWSPDRNWGYVQFNTPEEVTAEYEKYIESLIKLAQSTYSAGVYTQTTDVENEVNGLMTYDREVIKIDENRVKKINERLTHCLDK
ncbi:MAG: glycoside hydrolase family 2 [Clostridium sp.]|nr:glycoside hydrolase family 2 [Clostridium sp.]